jgi:hypothetical protein
MLFCCGALALFFDGYYLPFKPCRPITYPDGTPTTENLSYTTTVALDLVLSFFDQRLDAQPFPDDTLYWRKQKLGESKYLYACAAADINGLTTETGCIFVSREGNGTRIETILLRSEGGGPPCPTK